MVLLLLVGLSFAVPPCPQYPYRDHVFFDKYSPPEEPQDTLLEYCDFNPDPNCLFVSLVNGTEEKKLFTAESITGNSFEKIADWNKNLEFGGYPPNNSVTGSSYTIKDAWLSIVSVQPSVYGEDRLLVNSSGSVLTRHSFVFVVQDKKRAKDCRTIYRICGYNYSLDTYLDGEKINNKSNAEAFFNLTNSSEYWITSKLSIQSEYMVDHYKKKRHCKEDEDGDKDCWYSCDYYKTEDVWDSLVLSDSKKVYYENNTAKVRYILDGVSNNLADFKIAVGSNNSNINLRVGNAVFRKISYFHKVRFGNEPYNTLYLEKIPVNRTDTHAFSVLESENNNSNLTLHLVSPYDEDCELTIESPFDRNTFDDICNLSKSGAAINLTALGEGENSIRITALLYKNRSGTPLEEKEITFYHGGSEYSATTNSQGKAELLVERKNNVVTAEFETDFETRSAKRTIVLKAEEPVVVESLADLLALGVTAYLVYIPVKRVVPVHA